MSTKKEDVLVVHEPFGGYAKGEVIRDAEKIAEILAGENAHHVVKSVHEVSDDEPSAAPDPGR